MGFACNLSFTVFSFKFGFGWENVAGVLVSNEILRLVDKGEKSAFRFNEIFGFDDPSSLIATFTVVASFAR